MNDDYNPFDYEAVMEPLSPAWAAKRRIGRATRRLAEALVSSDADAALLEGVADDLEQQAAALEAGPRLYGRDTFMHAGKGSRAVLAYETGAVCGQANPVAPPLRLWIEAERAYAEVTMGWQYEGPPGCVHGGYVAALFDDFLGMAQKMTGQPGFTGTLSIRYRLPTPLETPLRLEGWVDKIEGRKNILKGELWAGDKLTATAEGLFIHVDLSHYLDEERR